jgi:hypothetical protein
VAVGPVVWVAGVSKSIAVMLAVEVVVVELVAV